MEELGRNEENCENDRLQSRKLRITGQHKHVLSLLLDIFDCLGYSDNLFEGRCTATFAKRLDVLLARFDLVSSKNVTHGLLIATNEVSTAVAQEELRNKNGGK